MWGRRSGGVDYGGCWLMCESGAEPEILREVLADISGEQRGQYRERREPSAGSPPGGRVPSARRQRGYMADR